VDTDLVKKWVKKQEHAVFWVSTRLIAGRSISCFSLVLVIVS